MPRTIEHMTFARLSFPDVIEILDRDSASLLATATDAASAHACTLVEHGDQPMHGFDATEIVTAVFDEMGSADDHHAWIEFGWEADEQKRLLPNVRARLDIQPLVRHHRTPSTELTLRAHYVPAPGSQAAPESVLFGRRVVNAALHVFLQRIVEVLEGS